MQFEYKFPPNTGDKLETLLRFDSIEEVITSSHALRRFGHRGSELAADRTQMLAQDLATTLGRAQRGYPIASVEYRGEDADVIEEALVSMGHQPPERLFIGEEHFCAHALYMISNARSTSPTNPQLSSEAS